MMNMEKIQYNVLEKVNTPDDLKKLSCDELKTLCDEIRAYIIDVLHPGHKACKDEYYGTWLRVCGLEYQA